MEKINFRVGRYLFFMLMFSAGMWNSATGANYHLYPYVWCCSDGSTLAFLPSTFAMFANMQAFSYALDTPSTENKGRTLYATLYFALGAIVGWPFSLALSIPFVLEELLIAGNDRIRPESWRAWVIARSLRLYTAGACAALLFVSFFLHLARTYADIPAGPGHRYRLRRLWSTCDCAVEYR